MHSATPPGHVTSHWLFTQTAVPPIAAVQTLPQVPQLSAVVFKSTQRFPHLVKPGLHATVHEPPAQAGAPLPPVGPGHAVHEAPQCAASSVVSKQVVPEPQVENPAEQPTPHTPEAQVANPLGVPLHAVVHLPQWVGSLAVLVSHPGVPSQSEYPVPQLPVPHLPATQVGVPFVAEQALPQAPQCETWVATSVSQPLSLQPSQLPQPALQSS